MPRNLSDCADWEMVSVDFYQLRYGDVIFTKKINMPKLVSHAAMILGPDKVMHCTRMVGKVHIQSFSDFFENYEQKLDQIKVLQYIDPRDLKLREVHKGKFIKNPTSY